ncbi:MAG: hypothetical protein CL666_15995 [Balneola sp.]|nr:hypothetical protein [Balneola sp.]|tara:strand:- start:35486 stop:36142 length:657 start_codon:yes stop_codon:yes gene_type:complete
MKRNFSKIALFSVLLFGLSGCFLKSVHPLVSDTEAIEFDQVKGTWESEDERFTFIKEGEWEDVTFNDIQGQDLSVTMSDTGTDSSHKSNPSYLVLYEDLTKEDPDSVYFIGKFIQLKQEFYLDLYPLDAFDLDFRSSHFLPVHTFSKVELWADSISIHLFRDSWIEDQIRDHKVRIKHEALEEGILITASTEELQQFIKKYGTVTEAYRDPISLKRVN